MKAILSLLIILAFSSSFILSQEEQEEEEVVENYDDYPINIVDETQVINNTLIIGLDLADYNGTNKELNLTATAPMTIKVFQNMTGYMEDYYTIDESDFMTNPYFYR